MADREFIVYQSCSRPKYHIKDFSISWLILLITGGMGLDFDIVFHTWELGIQFMKEYSFDNFRLLS